MIYFVSAIHVLLCVFMIFVILLQPGKDAGMGAALGGGAATSAFGGRGAVTFLGKVTAVCAIAYFVTSLGLSFVGLRGSVADSLVDETPTAPAPVAPAPAGAAPTGAAPAPVPNDGTAKPAEGSAPSGEAKPAEGAAAEPTVGKASDSPGTPVPAVPEKKVTGTEAGP
jgi:preprotein translocase subunit SecG